MQALDGGADGLDFYRKIIQGAKEHLCGGGQLFFEIGYDQGEAVQRLMEQAGYREVECVQDFAGLDRVVFGTLWVRLQFTRGFAVHSFHACMRICEHEAMNDTGNCNCFDR